MSKPKESSHYTVLDFSKPVKPPPPLELKEYEVWMEGYRATGEYGTASLWGKSIARSFEEACHKIACENYLKRTKEDETNPYKNFGIGRWDYDPHKLTYWACKLYETELEARKSFG